MKKSVLDRNESLDFRGLCSSASPSEIEAKCLYENMRESGMLRDTLKREDEWRIIGAPYRLRSRFFLSFTVEQLFRLMLALQRAGFPKPWQGLSKASRAELISLLACPDRSGDKELNPPVMIEPGAAEFDPFENCWRVGQVEPFELSLFGSGARLGGKPFLGFIRIAAGYNETEAVEAFRGEFRKLRGKTKGGRGTMWLDRLKQLAAMRIWKREPHQWKRLKLVAKICGYKGCKREAAAYKKRCEEGRADGPMSEAAKVEMSRARREARTFFQSFFPGEEPLSYS